jgi:hypothetical protein
VLVVVVPGFRIASLRRVRASQPRRSHAGPGQILGVLPAVVLMAQGGGADGGGVFISLWCTRATCRLFSSQYRLKCYELLICHWRGSYLISFTVSSTLVMGTFASLYG